MRRDERPWLQRHLVLAGAFALVTAGTVLYALFTAVAWSAYGRWSRQAEAVSAVRPSGTPAAIVVLPYRYRERTRFLTVRVSQQELEADRRVPTDVIFNQQPLLLSAYLRRLVDTQSHAPSVEGIALQLRAVRDSLGLDSDEYVELMARAVQDLPYGTPRPDFRLPAQTLLAGRGVCIDKSLLLSALLVHEGYDAGIWSLPAKNHVAVAIRGTHEGFEGSGYAFVETTQRAYIGEVPVEFAGREPEATRPLLVKAGGWRRYRADCETAFIVGELRQAAATASALEPYRVYAAGAAEGRRRREYEAEAQQQVLASAVAARLEWSSDDRAVAFETLEALNGWDRADERL